MTEIEVVIKALEDQRNQALAQVVNLHVQVFQLETRIEQLVGEIAERDKPIEEPSRLDEPIENEAEILPMAAK